MNSEDYKITGEMMTKDFERNKGMGAMSYPDLDIEQEAQDLANSLVEARKEHEYNNLMYLMEKIEESQEKDKRDLRTGMVM